MFKRFLAAAACAGLLSVGASAPALADGAASTRNIIFGAAAAGVGTWAIINHNKKVHQKIDEKDAQIRSLDQQRSNAESSYESEHQAYLHEVAVANHYMAETAALKRQVSSLKQQLAQAHPAAPVAVAPANAAAVQQPVRLASTSYGWGQL
jgi:hypothetical protein